MLVGQPADVAVAYDHCAVLASTGRGRAAQRKLESVLRKHEGSAILHELLGTILEANGEITKALHHHRRAATLDPSDAAPLLSLIRTHAENQQMTEAWRIAELATQRFPGNAEFLYQIGVAESRSGDRQACRSTLEAALAIDQHNPLVLYNLAEILDSAGEWDRAIELYRRAQAADRNHVLEPFSIGDIELGVGEVSAAIASEEAWLAKFPSDAVVLSNRLMAAQYNLGVTAAGLLDLHRRWNEHIARKVHPVGHSCAPGPSDLERTLRVGLVSADFRNHPVAYFCVRALERLDRSRFELVAYDCAGADDAMAQRLRLAVPEWHVVEDWADERLARRIREDRIDILIDLGGHIAGNRLGVFARRPAPVQATWLGYVGTTGLDAMDWVIADRHLIPDGDEAYHVEKVLRLPDAFACFDPPLAAPDVCPLPAGASAPLTFAAFHNPAKINSGVVALWARILREAPGSSLHFVYRGYQLPGVQARLRAAFEAAGADAGQLAFLGNLARHELLARYAATDIGLDPFPYTGMTTTAEALWMGVPVVTLPGKTFAGRHSLSHLAAADITGTVARDADEYVAIVHALGSDRAGLQRLRSGLRQRVADSPLCDAARFAANLGAGLRDMWREKCGVG